MAKLKKPRHRKHEAQAEGPESSEPAAESVGEDAGGSVEPTQADAQAGAADESPKDEKEQDEPGKPKLPEPWRHRRANWWTR